MPTCENCGPGTTPAVITAGSGLSLTGVGTPTAPYHFELASSDGTSSLQVQDSSTVNFTLYGSGTQTDPWVLTADTGSVAKLTSLADYSDTSLPNAGEVVTWVGSSTTGHWESRALPAATPGTPATTDASSLTTGILSNDRLSGVMVDKLAGGTFGGDANSLLVPGMYRTTTGWTNGPTQANVYAYGSLEVFAVSTTVTQTYYAHNGSVGTAGPGQIYQRTKYNASDWTAWGQSLMTSDFYTVIGGSADPSNNTPQFMADTSNWQVVRNIARSWGPFMHLDINLKRIGATLTATAAGFFTGQPGIGYLTGGFGIGGGSYVTLNGAIDNAGVLGGFIYTNLVYIAHGQANQQIRQNIDSISLQATWLRS